MVIATQNPIEHEGTYPLPESQLDRFLMRVSVGYPDRDAEIEMLDTHGDHDALDDIRPVATAADIQAMVAAVRTVHVAPASRATSSTWPTPPAATPTSRSACRPGPRSACSGPPGPAPRPPGRNYVVPDDLKALAEPVLAHRLVVTPEAQLQGISAGGRPRTRSSHAVPVPVRP